MFYNYIYYTMDFIFTLTIPPFKRINYKSGRKGHYYPRAFGTMAQIEQRNYLDDAISFIMKSTYQIKYVFEEHEDKRLHVHGLLFNCSPEDASDFMMNFYAYVGINSMKKYQKISDLKECINRDMWLDYINKNQHRMIKSRYDREQDHFKSLDHGIVNIENNISAQYFNSLGEHLESEILGNEYLFGKTNNKYIVEL